MKTDFEWPEKIHSTSGSEGVSCYTFERVSSRDDTYAIYSDLFNKVIAIHYTELKDFQLSVLDALDIQIDKAARVLKRLENRKEQHLQAIKNKK